MPSDQERLIVYFNGEFVPWNEARVHVFSPFAKYGAAVFEGIRGYWSENRGRMLLFRLREHMERLELSQRIMRFGEIVPARRHGARRRSIWFGATASGPPSTSGQPSTSTARAAPRHAARPVRASRRSRGVPRSGWRRAARRKSRPGSGSATVRCRRGQRPTPTTTTFDSPASRPASTAMTPPSCSTAAARWPRRRACACS